MKYKNGECIKDPPGVKHSIFHEQVRRWCRIYDSLGEIGLDHKRQTLTLEERLQLIDRIENGESCQSVALSAGIQNNLLGKWYKVYRQFHSDQGWQYQMGPYKKWLEDKGIKQSFSRKGNCMDNSLMENFFGIMKNEMFYGEEGTFETLEDLKEAMNEYIRYYNEETINVKRKGLTPLEYRHQSLSATI